jgi:hypothetical protein
MVRVPVRGGPLRGSTRNATVPLLSPSRPDRITIHGTSDLAVQGHPPPVVVTRSVRSPPAGSTVSTVEDRRNPHGLPSCEICRRCSATLIPVSRTDGRLFGATLNCKVPSPCPLDGAVSVSHDDSLCADHVHSRFVTTCIVPVPPSDVNDSFSARVCTSHRTWEGAVTVSAVEPQEDTTGRRTSSKRGMDPWTASVL